MQNGTFIYQRRYVVWTPKTPLKEWLFEHKVSCLQQGVWLELK